MRFLFCFSLCFLACNQIKVKVMRNKKHPSNWFTAVGFARIEEWVGEVEEYGRRKRNEEERLLYWRLKFSDVEFSTFLSFDMVAGIDLVYFRKAKVTVSTLFCFIGYLFQQVPTWSHLESRTLPYHLPAWPRYVPLIPPFGYERWVGLGGWVREEGGREAGKTFSPV